jgi:hypothetical protein
MKPGDVVPWHPQEGLPDVILVLGNLTEQDKVSPGETAAEPSTKIRLEPLRETNSKDSHNN